MGLDVYFHKVKRAFEGNPTNNDDLSAFIGGVDKDAQEKLRKFIKKEMKPLEEAWKNGQDYDACYFAFVRKLGKIIAKNFNHKIEPYTIEVLPPDELKEELDKEVKWHYEQYDAYFRKVNFIFHYFDVTLGTMQDQWFAFVTPEDIDGLIDRCDRVLKNHELAPSLLPTQSGFFFGSTDYDEWYFNDVKDCLRQMKKFRKGMKGKTAYVMFSW